MKLSSIGEFGFIKRISETFNQKLPEGIVGIGDDCAVIPIDKNSCLLVTTDMLVEDVHFMKKKISPFELGYKSLAVNLSDIAGMGGKPESAYISIAIPSETEVEWLDEFYEGVHNLANSEKILLLGGDTTKSPDKLVINFTVLGKAKPDCIKYRSTAKVNDIICVTDYVGDSGGGLMILLGDLEMNSDSSYLVQRHHKPHPQIQEGMWLASKPEVHAMMDISDGIDSDIQRIMESSGCGALIELNKLPISPALRRVSAKYNWDPLEISASGGEDYCLLVTVEPDAYENLASEFKSKFNRELTNIGVIKDKDYGLQYIKNGIKAQLKKHGYDHFV